MLMLGMTRVHSLAAPVLAALLILPALVLLTASPAPAFVAGPCANCHTMHNSQDGNSVHSSALSELLVSDCVGCHSAADGSTWKDPSTGAPIVYNASTPAYGADAGDGKSHGLAAGNFYWVDQDDSYGHNIFNLDSKLSQAPGNSSGCGGDCHTTLSVASCRGCHMLPDYFWPGSMKWHHADDSGTVVNSWTQGWYRFLSGHLGETYGVSGIEDPDWESSPSGATHNEYLGVERETTSPGGFEHSGNTMSGFCTGCHGDFHIQDTSPGEGRWVRHPSDRVLPATGEYANYTSYDPLVPVARPALTAVSDGVSPGQDLVMCLSCHRAHGSPYQDMLRFNFEAMVAGGGGADGTGCFKCHSAKDGA